MLQIYNFISNHKQNSKMVIQTFMFFDLETTGLPMKDNPAKITELTLICVSRHDIEKADGKTLPPINKLSLLFNPQKNVHPNAVKVTGLTKQILSNQPIFGDRVKCISSFLDAPKPVCLVAHNGNRFDYKIINDEYTHAHAELPQDLLCVDSLKAFKEIHNEKVDNLSVSNSNSSMDASIWPDLNVTPEEWKEIDDLIDTFSKLTSSPKTKEKLNSYKLVDIYKYLLNKQPKEAHRAEADCMMLLECVIATKHQFLKWADDNYDYINKFKSQKSKIK